MKHTKELAPQESNNSNQFSDPSQKPPKKKSKVGKWVLIVIGVFVVIGVATNMAGKNNAGTTPVQASVSSVSSSTPAVSSSATEGKITSELYEKVTLGASKDEVEAILGKGTAGSSNEIGGVKTESVNYTGSGVLSSAIITYQSGKVTNKTEIGLYDKSKYPTIDLAKYEQVDTGMSYDQVKQIFGGDGEKDTETQILDSTSYGYIWRGADVASNATLTFSNDKLVSKTQISLK